VRPCSWSFPADDKNRVDGKHIGAERVHDVRIEPRVDFKAIEKIGSSREFAHQLVCRTWSQVMQLRYEALKPDIGNARRGIDRWPKLIVIPTFAPVRRANVAGGFAIV
jgi:hypothetical protein